ncbi:molecular chaperone HtpG [Rhodoplanes sp. Z2-YC6860]|uniref:molecular chaperone HtpG n=1 Tax=Rhodoplanes sp. Z2-YC6860 TaxID=674703 RepID=UPI00078D77D2|nr:molecular chaperone HtpG [Rhodoplanes sp. Z2-YC6860]AMN41386.1 heat shock protein 90 [Rhodoplanes sp. Z2-YC6860]
MTDTTADAKTENRTFEADVSRLLHLMVHSVYSDKDVFLRELISNAADACERLRYDAIANPALLGDDAKPRITIALDADKRELTIEDNGIGMNHDELVDALGTIARSGTKAFMERLEAAKASESATLIGQFGVGFYSAFMVADRVDVTSHRAGSAEAWQWSSDGKGTYTVAPVDAASAPARGTRVVLHLMEDAKSYTERYNIERIVHANSGHVPVPISIIEKPGAEPTELADGAALWTKSRSEIKPEEYTDFYRSVAGQFDEPALTVHFRAEGRHEFTTLAFVPSARPFNLFDPGRKSRMKLYVKRVFITGDAEILPHYLRFVRGIVDSADLPLSLSREMIQTSPILAAIKKSVTGRVLSDLEKLADSDAEAYGKIWDQFGPVLKEGIYEDHERRDTLLKLARFRSTAQASETRRSLKEYVEGLKTNQTAIYYIAGENQAQIEASPHLEGFRARGVEVLLLSDIVDNLWVTYNPSFDGKPFRSVTQGAADLAAIPLLDNTTETKPEANEAVTDFIAFVKLTLGDAVSDVRVSDRLTDSAVCLVAPEGGPDRSLEKLLAGSGRAVPAAKPVLEINAKHELVTSLAALDGDNAFKEDAAHLLYDEARVLDGDRPADAKAFSVRLARLISRGVQSAKG